ncbi:MAG TPA: carboxylesterase family protein, partial [Streptosporangiaceae bacterium]|nr:carboxylesterase family protein [Streptosporangiaceae bacterium]
MRHIKMSWRSPARLGAGVIVAAALMAAGSAGASSAIGPVAATAGGAVRGMTVNSTEEFLGLPYAAPPTGALRWQPPAPPAPWSGVREAVTFAPHCPQPPTPFGMASKSEDCLYLNVFAPAHATGNLPVMVWIHGGAFLVGESNDYDPAALVRRGVVVVTLNYRLGALGFLADSALASRPGGPSGNYGLMDQQAALHWVQRNIRGFGGNPRDVTIFGQSTGGQSVLAQMASPGARGLFTQAIVESGTDELTQAPLATAEAAGAAFAAKVGCAAGTPASTAACLRSLPVSIIVGNEDSFGYEPDVDGAVLPRSVKTALASGQFNRVPVITGTNHDEYRLFVGYYGTPVTAANYQAMIASTLG